MSIAFAALFGLAFGSFANAAIDRIPRGLALTGRSRCDGCARELRAHELIPVLSYLLLRGNCGGCKAPIGIRTPLVEVDCAVGFAASFGLFDAPLAFAMSAVLAATTIGAGIMVERRRIHA